jgi:hypothetical protein
MKRRKFLKNSIPAGVILPGLLNGYSIKAFAEDSPFVQALMLPTTLTDHVLVLVQLNGGQRRVEHRCSYRILWCL